MRTGYELQEAYRLMAERQNQAELDALAKDLKKAKREQDKSSRPGLIRMVLSKLKAVITRPAYSKHVSSWDPKDQ